MVGFVLSVAGDGIAAGRGRRGRLELCMRRGKDKVGVRVGTDGAVWRHWRGRTRMTMSAAGHGREGIEDQYAAHLGAFLAAVGGKASLDDVGRYCGMPREWQDQVHRVRAFLLRRKDMFKLFASSANDNPRGTTAGENVAAARYTFNVELTEEYKAMYELVESRGHVRDRSTRRDKNVERQIPQRVHARAETEFVIVRSVTTALRDAVSKLMREKWLLVHRLPQADSELTASQISGVVVIGESGQLVVWFEGADAWEALLKVLRYPGLIVPVTFSWQEQKRRDLGAGPNHFDVGFAMDAVSMARSVPEFGHFCKDSEEIRNELASLEDKQPLEDHAVTFMLRLRDLTSAFIEGVNNWNAGSVLADSRALCADALREYQLQTAVIELMYERGLVKNASVGADEEGQDEFDSNTNLNDDALDEEVWDDTFELDEDARGFKFQGQSNQRQRIATTQHDLLFKQIGIIREADVTYFRRRKGVDVEEIDLAQLLREKVGSESPLQPGVSLDDGSVRSEASAALVSLAGARLLQSRMSAVKLAAKPGSDGTQMQTLGDARSFPEAQALYLDLLSEFAFSSLCENAKPDESRLVSVPMNTPVRLVFDQFGRAHYLRLRTDDTVKSTDSTQIGELMERHGSETKDASFDAASCRLVHAMLGDVISDLRQRHRNPTVRDDNSIRTVSAAGRSVLMVGAPAQVHLRDRTGRNVSFGRVIRDAITGAMAEDFDARVVVVNLNAGIDAAARSEARTAGIIEIDVFERAPSARAVQDLTSKVLSFSPDGVVVDGVLNAAHVELALQLAAEAQPRGFGLFVSAEVDSAARLMQNSALSRLVGGTRVLELAPEQARLTVSGRRRRVIRAAPAVFRQIVELPKPSNLSSRYVQHARVQVHANSESSVDHFLELGDFEYETRQMDSDEQHVVSTFSYHFKQERHRLRLSDRVLGFRAFQQTTGLTDLSALAEAMVDELTRRADATGSGLLTSLRTESAAMTKAWITKNRSADAEDTKTEPASGIFDDPDFEEETALPIISLEEESEEDYSATGSSSVDAGSAGPEAGLLGTSWSAAARTRELIAALERAAAEEDMQSPNEIRVAVSTDWDYSMRSVQDTSAIEPSRLMPSLAESASWPVLLQELE
ncbi:hypothetical protein FVE85_9703 [Porphyridium purpureum]|uniref:Uncharacterized protein n=1 Tax=Porphyridium purpureum TaxID=35688 RepID=A0A5J4YJR0_PORPP|nr:hypothetical protein FVE85_9703 [Porphyridium purpureum]|eukprot:POR1095..scf246_12